MSQQPHIQQVRELVNAISRRINDSRREPFILAIDGRGGSGKSTLTKSIKQNFPEATVIEMDDFIYPVALRVQNKQYDFNFDWKRLEQQVLLPLHKREEAKYQRYDWPSDSLAEWHTISPRRTVLVEGCYSSRKELREYYDLIVWVELDKKICWERGLQRERKRNYLSQEELRKIWLEEYQPLEDTYIQEHKPVEKADIIFETL